MGLEANGPALVHSNNSVNIGDETVERISCFEVNNGFPVLLPVKVCSVDNVVQMWTFVFSHCKQKCKMLWSVIFTMFVWLCMVICTQTFRLQSDLFSTKRHSLRIGVVGTHRKICVLVTSV